MALNRYIYRYSAAHSHFLAPFFAILKNFRVPDITGRVNAAGGVAWQEPANSFYFPEPEKMAYMAEYSATKQSPTGLGFKASNENAIYSGTTLQTSALRLMAIIKS